MIVFTGRIFREGDAYVSYCDQIDAGTCGATLDETYRRTEALIEIHLEFAREHGLLGELLARCGASASESTEKIPDRYVLNLVLSEQTAVRYAVAS